MSITVLIIIFVALVALAVFARTTRLIVPIVIFGIALWFYHYHGGDITSMVTSVFDKAHDVVDGITAGTSRLSSAPDLHDFNTPPGALS